MSQRDDIKKLIIEYSRRLQKLKEKKARLGVSADPSLDIEIEDIEAELEKLQTQLESLSISPTDSPGQAATTLPLPEPNRGEATPGAATPRIFLCHIVLLRDIIFQII